MNRIWMITGAGRGLGRAFTEEAVRNGDKVIATLRKPAAADDELMNSDNVLVVLMDVTDKAAVKRAVKDGYEHFGRIDVLINNAGYGMNDAFEEMTDQELRDIMETNFFGMTNVTREVLPIMRKQRSGMVIGLSSVAGAMGFIASTGYCAAKFAVTGFCDALALEMKPFGIQVTSVQPSAFRTDFRDLSSMKRASGRISDYEGSAAHQARDSIAAKNHQQEGDPARAAAFIYKIVESGKLPLRIVLGERACRTIREYYVDRIAEIDSYAEASIMTDFPQ